ncbi:receptor-like protein 2 [Prunus dulcis]|uniref:receptor-like protein 2 n=1 Tax=Prunus dulcis TaxID=3755 RepID=UPI0014832965|nr:receptor-like protein 2 [Prunus dulcis]
MYDATTLEQIALPVNSLYGITSDRIINLTNLTVPDLSSNGLSNMLPIDIGKLSNLKFMLLHTNKLRTSFLREEMPSDDGMVEFFGFQHLRVLDLSYCELTGPIPVWLSKLKKLQILNLIHNRITGSVPSWLATLPSLFYINVSVNLISGEFPKELCSLPMLVSRQPAGQVDHEYLEFPIFAQSQLRAESLEYNSLSYTQSLLYNYVSYFPPSIYLHNNSINGNIPKEIGQLKLLHVLDLGVNNFSSSIPDQISNLKKLETLDVSMNHLYGNIPASLTSLNFLKDFNCSYNNLEGPIPRSTQLQSFNSSAFEGNPKLCSARFQMNADQLMMVAQIIRTIKMSIMGIIFHGFIFSLRLL